MGFLAINTNQFQPPRVSWAANKSVPAWMDFLDNKQISSSLNGFFAQQENQFQPQRIFWLAKESVPASTIFLDSEKNSAKICSPERFGSQGRLRPHLASLNQNQDHQASAGKASWQARKKFVSSADVRSHLASKIRTKIRTLRYARTLQHVFGDWVLADT